MEKLYAVAALAALAQETRLDIFRLLVAAGEDSRPAGSANASTWRVPRCRSISTSSSTPT